MRMATPGQARLSLVRASPCPRLMRGPSRHHELFAVSTRFSVVSSVGPAGRHQPRRSGRRWQAVGAGRGTGRSAGCRQGRGGGLPSASLTRPPRVGVGGDAARSPHLPDVHLRLGDPGGLAAGRGRQEGGDGATGQLLEARLVGAGGARVGIAAGQRPPRQDPARPQDRRRRRGLAGRAAGVWAAGGQLRARRRRSASCAT
jgi:hypothetical protein